LPGSFLAYRVPGQQVGTCPLKFRRRVLGAFADIDGEKLIAHFRARLGHQWKTAVVGWDVNQAGVRVEGHRVPVMGTACRGHNMEAAVTKCAVVGLRVQDWPEVFIEPGHPVRRRYEQISRQHLACGSFYHVEHAILWRLHQHVLQFAVDNQIGDNN